MIIEIRINGKLAGKNWANELMNEIIDDVGRKAAAQMRSNVPEGASVDLRMVDKHGNADDSPIAERLKRGIEKGFDGH